MAESPTVVAHSPAPRRRWSKDEPPEFSDVTPLRVVLLGKSASDSSRVENVILCRSALKLLQMLWSGSEEE